MNYQKILLTAISFWIFRNENFDDRKLKHYAHIYGRNQLLHLLLRELNSLSNHYLVCMSRSAFGISVAVSLQSFCSASERPWRYSLFYTVACYERFLEPCFRDLSLQPKNVLFVKFHVVFSDMSSGFWTVTVMFCVKILAICV